MQDNIMMGVASAAAAAVWTYSRQMALPLVLLVTVMALDYVSGMSRAWFKHELSSKIGLRGIVKKLSYLFAVAVSVEIDLVLQLAAEKTSIDISGCYFCALLVMVWLILNECLSILENISEIGVPVPAFLLSLIRRLKQSAEKAGEKNDGHGKEDGNE